VRWLGKLSRRWLQGRRLDPYHRDAKLLGYRSRSAFKLAEICERHNILGDGDVVLDLGAAPGGWLQVAAERVGPRGYVLGVDLKQIRGLPHRNVSSIVLDVTSEGAEERVAGALPRGADAVLSDLSPNVSGVWELDHARQIGLAQRSISIAERVLRPGGSMVLKLFQGDLFDDTVSGLRAGFSYVRLVRPAASRKRSSEIYAVCKGFRPEEMGSAVRES